MSELSEEFLNLEIVDGIFKDIKYFITGEVHEKIESLLKSGGAERQNYFSDYVTHLIVGKNPEENDVADANDVYEIPAVTPKWVFMCASLKRRLDLNPYLFTAESKLFSGQIFCFSKVKEDRNTLWGLISFNGGSVHLRLTSKCNFLVTGLTEGAKYEKAISLGPEKIKIVTPDWVLEAVKNNGVSDPALFHPKLINWPKPVKAPEPTTAITGFEPETPENKEKPEEKTLPDSTQALLEKLKQRMPWNQPAATTSTASTSTASSDPIAPPNVVAPSFLSKMQAGPREQAFKTPVSQMPTSQSLPVVSSFANTGSQSPNHVPRSIVHHIPNSQQSQPSTLQNSPLNINRLIGQSQVNRPTNLHQLRGQLNTSQIHQQLLQQRIQQQNQQPIQRSSTGQINMNQQLLHQHLSQGRQALQNQLMNQQTLLNQQQNLLNQTQNINQINQNQQILNSIGESLNQDPLLGQQSQNNSQFSQSNPLTSQANQLSNQQNEMAHQRNQLDRSPSQNIVLNSPQNNQNQLLSPQLLNHQQQSPVNQLPQQNQLIHQQASQLLNHQVQNQLNQQQERANQLLNQQQERANQLLNQQQERANQLLNQQQQNKLNLQQERSNQLLNQQQNQSQLIQQQNQSVQQQLLGQQQTQNELQNQLLGQRSPQNQQQNQQNQQLIQQSQHNQQMLQQTQNQIIQSQTNQQLIQQNPQLMQQNQQMMQQNHPNQQLVQQNQQLNQQSQQLSQGQLNQQNPIIRQNQLINQQAQQILNQGGQHQPALLGLPPNHHLSQLSPQQLQQLQQLKREQQQLLNQSQNQLGGINQQSIGINQQNLSLNPQSQGQSQQLVNQNQQIIGQNQQIQMSQQQLIQNRVMQSQNLNQQINQGQTFNQQGLNQHLLNQKQQIFGQQPINTSQHQQLIQNNQNLTSQPQFVNQNQFDALQQQKLNQNNQSQLNQMNVQALNQQLQQQNLGQQLNQQLMQQSQQTNQSNLNQGLGLDQGINQNLGLMNQQQPNLNQQGGLNQQTINQQMNQVNPGINQQVIRTQFPQQVLINQGQAGPQRAQLNQQIWAQQQQGGGPIQGQQIVRHPVNVAVQQSPTSGVVGPRIQWPSGQQPGVPQRQFIQLDAHTHNQLQKMPPEQQHLFVAKLQKQRQLHLAKVQQRPGGHILIRGNVPQGLTPQQQIQWLQQQAKQQGIVLPPNIQQNLTPGNVTPQQSTPPAPVPPQHAPGLSPINQPNASGQGQQFVGDQPTQQQIQLRQYRLQQLQLQREQAQKNALAQQSALPPQAVVRPPLVQPPAADSTTNPQVQVNPKTKTALANMLSIKLQSGGTIGAPVRSEGIPEPSAAGTLRMMTAQHHAAINSKPQEIIALHQRRVISGPNGEIIKPPGTPALPITPQNEPPKLQYNPKAPIPVQHRVGPFYGHNPNLKLPPDLFLLGCIFVVVEVEDYLEEKLPGWQQKIEKYGGEVEKQYCNKVTHVLCETQRHGVVMQALRDLKRCVTIRWLSDVIKRKQVLPPWTALHLPQIYLDISPASKHLISISGFEGNLRQVVKQMVIYTGAKCTNYFSKHNTLLICSKAEGKKYNHAKKWGIPVVNVQWLTDIILGNFTALNQIDNQAYQTYSNPPNLSFDPKLVPNMMHAWKAPINISQESYERVKRSASPVSLPKPKKQKTEHTDENENITEEIVNSNYKILFSQFEPDRLKELQKMVRELGGVISKDHKDFTHLVVPKLARTNKFLFALVKSCHVLPDKWLEESLAVKSFIPENEINIPVEEFNQAYGVTIEKVMLSSNKNKLLEGKSFWITPSVFPSKKVLSELIELSGGKLERIRRSRAQIEATNNTSPLTYFILTAKEDLHLVADLLKNKKDKQKVVCNVELVLSAIVKQEFEVDSYAVSVV